MTHVRWAVVGTSDFALDWIARGISQGQNAHLAAIVSRDRERGAEAARRVGAPHVFTSIDEIDRTLVDGVFLVLPNRQHASAAITAANRGLHVICEKPMAPTLEECTQMVAAARANRVTLAVAHCMEWTPPISRARELLEEGAIGTVLHGAIAASYSASPNGQWRQGETTEAGGGPLMDMGSHAIDAITRLLGPVERVAAFLDRRIHTIAAEDSATLLLRFASGAHGTVQSSFTCYQNSLEIQGTEGRIWSNTWWGRELSGDLHLQRGKEVIDFELPTVNVYVPQIEQISASILAGTPPVVRGERGMTTIAVIRAAIESARTGTVVAVG